MKERVKNLWTAFLGLLLPLLGFQSCELIGIGRCEYGCPHADYKYIGEVSDEDGKPLKGIRMIVAHNGFEDEYAPMDTLYTDASGRAETAFIDQVGQSTLLAIKFEDVDGPDGGGSFKSRTISGEGLVSKQTGKGDGKWYGGQYTITAKARLNKENN